MTLRVRTAYVHPVDGRLALDLRPNGWLWAELDCKYIGSTAIPPLACPLYGFPNPNVITCWQGKLTSNKLRLPR